MCPREATRQANMHYISCDRLPNSDKSDNTQIEKINLNLQTEKNLNRTMSSLISAVAWVKRGVATRHPQKYVLDDNELQRVSALAHIELEDARVEMERAHKAAQEMGKGAEGDEADDIAIDGEGIEEDDGDANWVESVSRLLFYGNRNG